MWPHLEAGAEEEIRLGGLLRRLQQRQQIDAGRLLPPPDGPGGAEPVAAGRPRLPAAGSRARKRAGALLRGRPRVFIVGRRAIQRRRRVGRHLLAAGLFRRLGSAHRPLKGVKRPASFNTVISIALIFWSCRRLAHWALKGVECSVQRISTPPSATLQFFIHAAGLLNKW